MKDSPVQQQPNYRKAPAAAKSKPEGPAGVVRLVAVGLAPSEPAVECLVPIATLTVDKALKTIAQYVPRPPRRLLFKGVLVPNHTVLMRIVNEHIKKMATTEEQVLHETIDNVLVQLRTPKAGDAPIDDQHPAVIAAHHLWEFACRDELRQLFDGAAPKLLCDMLSTATYAPGHQAALSVVSWLAAVPSRAGQLQASGAVAAVAAAVVNNPSLCGQALSFVSSLLRHNSGVAVLARNAGMELIVDLVKVAMQQGNQEYVTAALQQLCNWAAVSPSLCVPCLAHAHVAHEAMSWLDKMPNLGSIEILCIVATLSRMALDSTTQALLAMPRMLRTMIQVWHRLDTAGAAALMLPAGERAGAMFAVQHARKHVSVCLWVGVVATTTPSLGLGADMAMWVRVVLAMLREVEMFDVRAGLALIASLPPTVEMSVALIRNGVLDAIDRALRRFETNDLIMEEGMTAAATLLAVEDDSVQEHAWGLAFQELAVKLIMRTRHKMDMLPKDNANMRLKTFFQEHSRGLQSAVLVLYWMHNGRVGSFYEDHQATMCISAAMQFPDAPVLYCAAVTLWRAATDTRNQRMLIQDGVLEWVTSWINMVVKTPMFALRSPRAGGSSRRVGAAGLGSPRGLTIPFDPSNILTHRIVQQLTEAPHLHFKLLEALTACAWLLIQSPEGANVITEDNWLGPIISILQCHATEALTAQHISVCILWTLVLRTERPEAESIILALAACFDLTRRPTVHVSMRIFIAEFLLSLSSNPKLRPHLSKQCGEDYRERMLMDMLGSADIEHQTWAVVSVIRFLTSPTAKRTFAVAGGTEAIVHLLHRAWLADPQSPMALLCCHALLNLTTEPACQSIVGQIGIELLMELAKPTHSGEMQEFAKRILRNISQHSGNRTPLYKAELHLKGEKWREESLDPMALAMEVEEHVARSGQYTSVMSSTVSRRASTPSGTVGHGTQRSRDSRPSTSGGRSHAIPPMAVGASPSHHKAPHAACFHTVLCAPSKNRSAQSPPRSHNHTGGMGKSMGARNLSNRKLPVTPITHRSAAASTTLNSTSSMDEIASLSATLAASRMEESPAFRWEPAIAEYSSEAPDQGYDPRTMAVVLAAPKAKQRVAFHPAVALSATSTKIKAPLRMACFRHVDGSHVCEDLYRHFVLPDGTMAHFYQEDDLCELPFVSQFSRDGPATTLDGIFVCKAPMPPRINFPHVDAIPLAPLMPFVSWQRPSKHLLPTLLHDHDHDGDMDDDDITGNSQGAHADCEFYGHLPSPQILTLEVEVSPQSGDGSDGFELPFDLNDSVFRPRAKECASKAYYDTSIYSRTCQIDWKRMCAKSRVQKLFNKSGVDATKQRAMEEAVVAQYSMLSGIFDYYASIGGGVIDPFSITMNEFTGLLTQAGLIGTAIERSDVDLIYNAVNQEEGTAEENAVNSNRALCRFELLEVIVRLSLQAFAPNPGDSPVEAVNKLMREHLQPLFDAKVKKLDANDFRRTYLYTRDVNAIFKRHLAVLKLLHQKYSPKTPGLKQPRMEVRQWIRLMKDCALIDDIYTEQDAVFAFTFSRMQALDELRQHTTWRTLSFVDFLEALAKAAWISSMPSIPEMTALNVTRCDQYMEAVVKAGSSVRVRRPSAEWGTIPTRPLAEKIERLLELMFSRLDKTGDGTLSSADLRSWM